MGDPNFVLSWDYDAENITMEFPVQQQRLGLPLPAVRRRHLPRRHLGRFRRRLRRPLDTRDKVDVPIVQGERMVVLWAYSQDDIASSYAQASGISYVTFLP